MSIAPNEIFRLVLAFGLAPVAWALARELKFPSATWPFAVMYAAVAISYAMTVVEGLAAPATFALLQHSFTAVGAVAFAMAARAVYMEVRRQKGPGS